MNIAVTGGSGFIGSHVVDKLVDAGHDVHVIDLRAPHRLDVAHHSVAIEDLDGLVAATKGAEVVFHLAAVADVNVAAADPIGTIDLNVTGTARVWEACRQNRVRRAVLASTVWVYGAASGPLPLDEDSPFLLDEAGHLYTSSKLAAELVVQSYHDLYGLDFTVLRYGIPYGPRMRPALVIPRFVERALAGEPIMIEGDGTQYRNYVYVEDLARAHVLALRPEAANQVLNIEGSEPVSIRRLVDGISDVLGRSVAVEYTAGRAGDFAGRPVSAARAATLIGWQPETLFDEGLRRYVDWHRAAEAPAFKAAPVPAGRTRLAVSALAGLGIASLAVPAFASTVPSVTARVGSVAIAGGVAVLAGRARRGMRPLGPVVGLGAGITLVWLIGQAPAGMLSVAASVLLGLVVGLAAVHDELDRRDTGLAVLAGVVLLGIEATSARSVLLWTAGALVAIPHIRRTPRPPASFRRAVPVATATIMTLLIGLLTLSVGASSASAAWFGPVSFHGSRAVPEVALTFSGLPDDSQVRALVDALDHFDVRATFFIDAAELEHHPGVVSMLRSDGQLIGDRTFEDRGMRWANPRAGALERSQDVFARQLAVCPRFIRSASSDHTPLMSRLVRRKGGTLVTWDVRASGHSFATPTRLANHLVRRTRRGSVIDIGRVSDRVQSDIVRRSLPLLFTGLRHRGMHVVPLDHLLRTPAYGARC